MAHTLHTILLSSSLLISLLMEIFISFLFSYFTWWHETEIAYERSSSGNKIMKILCFPPKMIFQGNVFDGCVGWWREIGGCWLKRWIGAWAYPVSAVQFFSEGVQTLLGTPIGREVVELNKDYSHKLSLFQSRS